MKRGATILELLAAMVISALVVVLASRIFITGNHQYLARVMESKGLANLYRMKVAVAKALGGEIAKCETGRLWLRVEDAEVDLQSELKGRFPELESADFYCLELDRGSASFLDWKARFQPSLVEYRLILKENSVWDSLIGSTIK
ncbi:MAG: hypothetical protein M3Y08_06160 [Fibrobacterota bacterium]|nr:hypothetical protein [Fibrobacterota bacterium]